MHIRHLVFVLLSIIERDRQTDRLTDWLTDRQTENFDQNIKKRLKKRRSSNKQGTDCCGTVFRSGRDLNFLSHADGRVSAYNMHVSTPFPNVPLVCLQMPRSMPAPLMPYLEKLVPWRPLMWKKFSQQWVRTILNFSDFYFVFNVIPFPGWSCVVNGAYKSDYWLVSMIISVVFCSVQCVIPTGLLCFDL